MYVLTDETGRICATTDVAEYAEGMQEFTFPDDFDFTHIGDYLIKDGALVYDGAQTAEEEAAEAAAEAAKAIEEEKNAFFTPGGGKAQMEQDIKDAAASGGEMNPQIMTFAALALAPMAATLSDEQIMSVSSLWPEWSPDAVAYKVDEVVQYSNKLWRCEQSHTSQSSWMPDAAPSLWSQIDIADDGIDVWTQPTGAHNAYNKGDRVHYPGKDGAIYESLIDGNSWSPDAYPQGWKLVEDVGETTEPEEPEEPGGETYSEWKQPTGAHDAYSKGDKVSHNGKNWVSDVDGNVWEPGVYGWTEE